MWLKYGLKAQAPSPGHRRGIGNQQAPCKGKSLMFCPGVKALALTGRQVRVRITQGDALG